MSIDHIAMYVNNLEKAGYNKLDDTKVPYEWWKKDGHDKFIDYMLDNGITFDKPAFLASSFH